jgi:hypothetical protein
MFKLILVLCLIATISFGERIALKQRTLKQSDLENKKEFLRSKEFTEQMTKAIESNDGGNLPIKDYTDTQYLAEMTLGNPGQSFEIVPDTGSSNIWVYSSKCWFSPACYIHHTYKESKSSSFEHDDHKFELNYGSGGVKGFWSREHVEFGGLKADNFTFGEVNSASGISFIVGHMDGILGLAYDSISVDNLPVFIDSADTQDHSFSFLLGHTDSSSYLVLPGTDEDFYTGDLVYHNVIEEKYWSLNMTDIQVGDQHIEGVSGYKGVIDSGTSLIVGSSKIVDPIIAQIGTIDQTCANNTGLPDVTFSFEGVDYTLTSEEYIVKVESFLGTACLLGIMGSEFPEGFDYLIIGDVFMRKFYTHFDKDNNRVGFALANHQ